MTLLIVFIAIAVGVSFLCSILEAVILSCTPSYLESLRDTKPKTFKRASHLIQNIEKSLAAILSLNTFAHTIGAAGAGAQAQLVFGDKWMTLFSVALTLLILFASEIIPKSIGARFWKQLIGFSSRVLPPLVVLSYPLVIVSGWLSKLIKGKSKQTLSRNEIRAFADLGLRDGIISKNEHRIFRSLMLFPDQEVSSIQKDFDKVLWLPTDITTEEAFEKIKESSYSRIPIIDEETKTVEGYVLKDDILLIKALDQKRNLESLKKRILKIDPQMKIETLFVRLLNRHEHIAAVIDEHGDFLGIVSLEDVIETMLDKEIFDEMDMLNKKTG